MKHQQTSPVTLTPSELNIFLKRPLHPDSYLTPVVIHVRVACVDVGCHVEVLCREHGLLLLHVHASTLDQSIGS